MYLVTQLYEGSQKKKILSVLLVYAILMICDVFSVFSLGDYVLGGEYNEIATYTTTLYFGICEFIIEKLLMKRRRKDTLPPYCNILIFFLYGVLTDAFMKLEESAAFDLNVVIGNLLDNAILAASQTQEKWLSVVLNYEKGILFIQVQNSYQTVKKDMDGNYLTTKQETQNHGIGLKNVRRIVNQNHGTMQITDSDHIFDVKVMLYV